MEKKKAFPHELIGEEIEIVSSANESYIGIRGRVIDESKNMLLLEKGDGSQVKLLKNAITFRWLKTGEVVSGKDIAKRPEERLKGN